MFEHKSTLVRVIHHLYVFSFQNPIWDLNNHFFKFSQKHTHSKHLMTIYTCSFKKAKSKNLSSPGRLGRGHYLNLLTYIDWYSFDSIVMPFSYSNVPSLFSKLFLKMDSSFTTSTKIQINVFNICNCWQEYQTVFVNTY